MARKPTGRKPGRPRKNAPRAGAGAGTSTGPETVPTDPGAGEAPRPLGNVAPAAPASVAVEVDRAALLQEAAQIAAEVAPENPAPAAGDPGAEAPAPQVEAPAAPPDQRAGELAPLVRMALAKVCDLAAPNWQVTRAESDSVGDALALVLAYWMPAGTMDPKYAALIGLGVSAFVVVDARRDPETGRLKPLRAAPASADGGNMEKESSPATPAAAPTGGALPSL